jgi:hypothetical protein
VIGICVLHLEIKVCDATLQQFSAAPGTKNMPSFRNYVQVGTSIIANCTCCGSSSTSENVE